MTKQPLISEALVDYLNALYPEACAELNDSERMIFFKAGRRDVVRHLTAVLKQQQKNATTAHVSILPVHPKS